MHPTLFGAFLTRFGARESTHCNLAITRYRQVTRRNRSKGRVAPLTPARRSGRFLGEPSQLERHVIRGSLTRLGEVSSMFYESRYINSLRRVAAPSAFTDCLGSFAVRVCSVRAVRSLSAGLQ